MNLNAFEAKVIVLKLVELSYSENKGLTAKLFAQKGPVKLTMDQNGHCQLSGSAGPVPVSFSGASALESIGTKVMGINVSFSSKAEGKLNYIASFSPLKFATFSISGGIDIEKFVTESSPTMRKIVNHNRQLEALMTRYLP